MEPELDLGLGDSSLHRYLDGEHWTLKNELNKHLGGCPLFRQRYPAVASVPGAPWQPSRIAPQPW